MKAHTKRRCTTQLIPNLDTRWRWVVNFTLLSLHPLSSNPATHLIEGTVGPRARQDVLEYRKSPCRALNPGSSSLKPSHHIDTATDPPLMLIHEAIKNCDVTILFCNWGMREERLGNFFRHFPVRSSASVLQGMHRCSHLFWRKQGGRPHNAGHCDKWHDGLYIPTLREFPHSSATFFLRCRNNLNLELAGMWHRDNGTLQAIC